MAQQKGSHRKNPFIENLESRLLLSATYSVASYTGLPGANNGVARPNALITAPNGNIFGTTQEGGPLNYGTIFEILAGTNNVLTLATFENTTGVLPEGRLVLDSSGNLFGVASGGGTNNRGAIWELKAGASTITDVWNFIGANGGAYPQGGLVADSTGNLWGTTFGNDVQDASVFEFTPPAGLSAGTFQTFALFPKDTHLNSTLAIGPDGLLDHSDGFVYGTVYNASGHSDGQIFRLGIRPTVGNQRGNLGAPQFLADFNANGNDASLPVGTLLKLSTATNKSELVGMTVSGGSDGQGTLWQFPLNTANATISDIARFSNTATIGRNPLGTLLVSGSRSAYTLTGVTAFGGESGNGGVFQTTLFTATNGAFTTNSNRTPITNANGNAVTQLGTTSVNGHTTAPTLTDASGINPTGGLAIAPDGSIYFTTANKGLLKNGSVVQLTTSGAGPDTLVFNNTPASGIAGTKLAGITLRAINADGAVDTSANGLVTLAVASGPGIPTLDGNGTPTVNNPLSITATMVNGVVTFSNITFTTAGSFTLRATDTRRDTGQSNQFTIVPATASQLVVVQQPSAGNLSKAVGTITVNVEDKYGNIVTTDSSNVTLTSAGGIKVTNGTVRTNKGVATFNNASFSAIGNYTLTASDGTLAKANLSPISVTGAATSLLVNAPARVNVLRSFLVQVRVLGGTNQPVTLSVASKPNGSNVTGTFTVIAVNGIASFSDLVADKAGAYTFRVSSPGLALVTSRTVNAVVAV